MLLVFIYPTLYTIQLESGKIQWQPLAPNTPDLHSFIQAFPIIVTMELTFKITKLLYCFEKYNSDIHEMM